MNKILLCISLLILNSGCFFPKKFKELRVENYEIGKCYFTEIIDRNKVRSEALTEKSFVIEVTNSKYEEIQLMLTREDMEKDFDKYGYFRFQIKESTFKILFKNSDLENFNKSNNDSAYVFCLAEIPGEWRTIYKEEIDGESVLISSFKLIAESKLIKKYVNKRPDKLEDNQMYFESGSWSQPKEVIANSHRGGDGEQIIRQLQEKLVRRGYQLQINNVLDKKTKTALFDFQRKNGLKAGQINLETLKKLEIKEFR